MTEAAAAAAMKVRATERKMRYRRAGMNEAACGPTENIFPSAAMAVAAREFDFQEALVTARLGAGVAAATAAEEKVQEEVQEEVIRTNRGVLWAENGVLRARAPPAVKLVPG